MNFEPQIFVHREEVSKNTSKEDLARALCIAELNNNHKRFMLEERDKRIAVMSQRIIFDEEVIAFLKKRILELETMIKNKKR